MKKSEKKQAKVDQTTGEGQTPVNAQLGEKSPQLKPGTYADGLPFHQLEYLCCKLMLRPNRFTSRQSLFDFAKVMRAPAEEHGVELATKGFHDEPLKIREVLFVDTPDFRLYNNAFILRRRIPYMDGFPVGDPEIVFKFRHPDIRRRPRPTSGRTSSATIGSSSSARPCRSRRSSAGSACSTPTTCSSRAPRWARAASDMSKWTHDQDLPGARTAARRNRDEKIELVSNTIIEEVLQDIGVLDFGQGVTAKTNVAIWRTRGEHRPLIGEFAFQIRFKDRKELARRRCSGPRRSSSPCSTRPGLDRPQSHEDGGRLPVARQPAQIARMSRRDCYHARPRRCWIDSACRTSICSASVSRSTSSRHDDRLVHPEAARRQQSDLGDRLDGGGRGPAAGGGAPDVQ